MRERWPDLPVVFVSGHTGRAASDLDLGAPSTAFLQKPFRLSELEHTVRRFLDHAPPPS